MATPSEKVIAALEAAGKAMTLLEHIAAWLGRGDPIKQALSLRLRAIRKRTSAAKARTANARKRRLADAAGFDAAADVLDPGDVCGPE
jgi:hypothetical protein